MDDREKTTMEENDNQNQSLEEDPIQQHQTPRRIVGFGIDFIGEDLLQNILSRLPAVSFAFAACVSRSWNLVCNRILSRPKLSSALSLNSTLKIAVKEVLDKVLSEPIRPHFAIAYISPKFNLLQTRLLITKKLGSETPVIVSESYGIIGTDVLNNKFKEVQWDVSNDENSGTQADFSSNIITTGIILTVGFLPGLKVDIIPLLHSVEEPQGAMIDKFIMDIREYSASVSGSSSPAGIILFGGHGTDMKPVLEKIDYAMPMMTFIVGGENGKFLYAKHGDLRPNSVAVALLFARDINKSHDVGETYFHTTLSTGVSPIGPTHKAASVKDLYDDHCTWLTARREGQHEILDGETILNDINDLIEDHIECPALYIGVIKRRKCSIGLEKARWITSMAFHEVLGGDEEYLFVSGLGVRTGDTFQFYKSDHGSALLSIAGSVSENLRRLKQENGDNPHVRRGVAANSDKKEVFGGLIFSCCGRGEPFFGLSNNVDTSPFLDTFPGLPLSGAFCGGEISRTSLTSYSQEENDQESDVRCCLHVFSTVYLVMSYTPVPPQP